MWPEEVAASESQYSGKDKIIGKRLNISNLGPVLCTTTLNPVCKRWNHKSNRVFRQSFTKLFNNHSKIVFNFKTIKDQMGRLYLWAVYAGHLIYFARMKTLGKSLRKVFEGKHKVRGMWIRK